MNNRTIAIIVTVVAALLFGCPGLISLCLGVTVAIVGLSGDPDFYFGIDTEPNSTLLGGLIFICLSVVLIAIPVVVGFLLVRHKIQPEGNEIVVIDAEAHEPSESESSVAQEKPEEIEDDIPPAI